MELGSLSIAVPGLLMLAGICAYAMATHLAVSYQRPVDTTHRLFAGVCLMAALLGLSNAWIYGADSVDEYATALKVNIAIVAPLLGLLLWFTAAYSGVRPRRFLVGMTLLLGTLFVINLFQPYSLQFEEITALQQQRLPWGEELAQPRGRQGLWFAVAVATTLTVLGYELYAMARHWRRERHGMALAMLLAVVLHAATSVEGMLVRANVIDFVILGPYGFLGMVIIMSVAYSRELRVRLHDSEHRYRSLVEQAPVSIQVLAPDGRTRQVNPAWEKLWGIKIGNLADYNILQDPQLVDKGVMSFIEKGFGGEATEIPPIVYNPAENLVVRGPVRDRWVRGYLYPIRDAGGTVSELILIHEDITERKRQEAAILHIAAGVSAATGDAFFQAMVTQLGKVFDAKYAFIGLTDEQDPMQVTTIALSVDGKVVDNLSYRLDNSPCANVLGRSTCTYPARVMQRFPKDALLKQMGAESYLGTPLFDTGGKSIGLVVVLDTKPMRDIGQVRPILEIFAARAAAELDRSRGEVARQTLQGQLFQAQKMESIGHLTGGIAHDFNNMLGVIMGYADLIKMVCADTAPQPERTRKYADEILAAGDRAKNLIAQMLLFSRLRPEAQEGETPVVLIQPSVEEIMHLLRSSIPSTIELALQVETPDLRVRIQPVQLHQILLNLVINARDAVGEYGRIDVKVSPRATSGICDACREPFVGDYVELAVSDSGSGIPSSLLSKIFDPFFTTKEVGKGTGMGLSVVHGIVHALGGHITVASAAGRGTTMHILLPVTVEEPVVASAPAQPAAPAGALAGLRIMVVDDERAIASLLQELLSVYGALATAYYLPSDALSAFEGNPESIDLVITDETMPGLSGLDMAKAMLHVRPDLPIILCTGLSEQASLDVAAQFGISGFMYKPVDIQELLQNIQRIVR